MARRALEASRGRPRRSRGSSATHHPAVDGAMHRDPVRCHRETRRLVEGVVLALDGRVSVHGRAARPETPTPKARGSCPRPSRPRRFRGPRRKADVKEATSDFEPRARRRVPHCVEAVFERDARLVGVDVGHAGEAVDVGSCGGRRRGSAAHAPKTCNPRPAGHTDLPDRYFLRGETRPRFRARPWASRMVVVIAEMT